jgi:lysophospholipase L1-like esterase
VTALRRHAALRWLLRVLFALVACELSLHLAAWVFARVQFGGSVAGAVVCIGDSNTYGQGAPRGRSYPDQMRELLAKDGETTPVVNLAFPGLSAGGAVKRLEDALEDGTPRCVVFLAGHNDFIRCENLLQLNGGVPMPTRAKPSWFEQLRTVRMAVAAWRIVDGDYARLEYGGAPRDRIDVAAVPDDEREAAFAKAVATGAAEIFPWLVHHWRREEPVEAQRAFDALLASRDFALYRDDLAIPLDDFRYELAMLAGAPLPPPPPATSPTPFVKQFEKFAAAYSAFVEGRLDEAERVFVQAADQFPDKWQGMFAGVHAGFVALQRRDWPRAANRLLPLWERMDKYQTAEHHACGGGVLAALFADDTRRLPETMTVAQRARWNEMLGHDDSPDGTAWMVAAAWVDALKGRDAAAVARCAELGKPILARLHAPTPLRWLADHPGVDFATARSKIELSPPRASWLGARGVFFRQMTTEELSKISAPAFARFVELARTRRFPVVVLTYLDYEKKVPSDRLRAYAAENGWPLVDLQAKYPVEMLGADGKTRYFTDDRSHPNEAGYSLMASAVEPVVLEVLKATKSK